MYDSVKTANLLNSILEDMVKQNDKKANLSEISKNIGISRRKFSDMLLRSDKAMIQDPSLSVINKIINYFKQEGYYLNFDNFVTSETDIIYDTSNMKITVFDDFVEPMYISGTIVETIPIEKLDITCNILIKNKDSNIYKIAKYHKQNNDYKITNLTSNTIICKDTNEIIGKIINIK